MLFFTINLLTSNLGKHLGLLFEVDYFLRGLSQVVEMSKDLAFRESLYTFADSLVRGENIISILGGCLLWWTDVSSLQIYR